MLKTLKKMILHTRDDSDLDKPHVREERSFEPREDYHIPEPEDISRLPNPGFQEPSRPLERREEYREPYKEPTPPPLERPMGPSVPEPRAPPRPSIEDQIREIMYRLDDIERRLARLEGTYPAPRRY